jgi:hypothetical protein
MGEVRTPSGDGALRAEHDILARRLEARRSVDAARRGLLRAFGGLLALGISAALAWERWGPSARGSSGVAWPGGALALVVVLACLALAAALLAGGAAALRLARRLARDEAALFERLRALRLELGIDP